MPEPTYEPQPVGDPKVYWIDYEKLDEYGQPTIVYEQPPETIPGGVFGSHNRPYKAKRMERVTFDNGEIFDFDEDNNATYVRTDPQKATAFRASQKQSSPTVREGPDGNLYQWDAESGEWIPAPGVPGAQSQASKQPAWGTTSTSSPYLVRPKPDGTLEQIPNPNYRPPGADRDPLDQTYKSLQNQKLQRDLMDGYSLAREQQYKMIADIQRRLADGEIDEKEADRLMGMANQSFNASLKGTTPWQMEQAKAGLARNTLNDRMNLGGNLATGLMSTFNSMYDKMYSEANPTYNVRPFQMAKDLAEEYGGGAELSELARAVLKGALGGQENGW